MRNCFRLLSIVMVLAVMGSAFAASDFEAREGSILGGSPPGTATVSGDIIDEEFVDITTLPGDGWAVINNSEPIGLTSWFQGSTATFPAHNGLPSEYIGGNYNACSTVAPEVISEWLISPEIDLSAIGAFSFWTRTVAGSSWPDRLQVRVSTNGSSTDVGTSSSDVGDFTTMLDDINAGLTLGGYPEDWAEFSYAGAQGGGAGRLALRYFVSSAGPAGVNSNYIGVDSFNVDSGGDGGGDGGGGGVPATSTWGVILLIALFMTVSLFYLRKRGSQNA
jgi:hypothetical protein